MGEVGQPSWVRWRMVALLMAFSGMSYFNRISMSVAGTEQIMPEYGIDETRMGTVYSAFILTYTLCMTPGGLLIDVRGPRFALLVMGLGSGLFVALTGLIGLGWVPVAMMLGVLLVVRALAGAMSAPIYPAAARAMSFWLPWQTQAWGNALVTGAALLGSASTYFLFGALMDVQGWRWAFVTSGITTIALALLWAWYATDDPQRHPATNEAERLLLQENASSAHAPREHSVLAGLGRLLCDRNLVLLTISYAAVGYFEYLFYYWNQYYFRDVLQLGNETSRLYATITSLSMAVGIIVGGWLAGRFLQAFGPRRGRAIMPVWGMSTAAILLIMGLLTRDPILVLICFSLAMAAVGSTEGPFWATAIALGGKRGGTSAAIFNTGGNLGGLLAPVVTPWLSDHVGWQGGFGLASLVALAGAALWCGIDPAERHED